MRIKNKCLKLFQVANNADTDLSLKQWLGLRRGSTINTDRFPALREVWRYAPLEVFWILTLQNLLSRVYESFRQDTF